MENQSLVSVIVNCYNGERYLSKAIDSIISQSYKNWELIFWDNNSTDRSASIFKKYNDKRLKYFFSEQHTTKLYEARNKAINKARGDFIAFLDVDDWWIVDKLEKQINLFDNEEVGMVYGNFWLYKEKDGSKKIYTKKNLPSGSIANKILKKNIVALPTVIIRKKAIESLSYIFNNNYHIIGDFDLNVRLALNWSVDCVQTPVAFYRMHEANESLLKKDLEITELKDWVKNLSQNIELTKLSNIKCIYEQINYLICLKNIRDNKYLEVFKNLFKLSLFINVLKVVIILILPNKIINILRARDD